MNQTQANKFIRARADELRSLGRVLFDEGIVPDTQPLEQAAGSCRLIRDGKQFRWAYELQRLRFRSISIDISGLRHTRPRTLEEMSILLDVTLEGECLDNGAFEDPLRELAVDVQIEGVTTGGDILTSAWHLDRHIFGDENHTDQEDGGSPHFVHPHYHFQYGGAKMVSKADAEFGTVLLLDPPRIAHPPLDAILAVDFVVSNYFGPAWHSVRSRSGPYNDLLRESQMRLWRPYAAATATFWNRPAKPAWDVRRIWPQLFEVETLLATN